jgi:hypothetical protein
MFVTIFAVILWMPRTYRQFPQRLVVAKKEGRSQRSRGARGNLTLADLRGLPSCVNFQVRGSAEATILSSTEVRAQLVPLFQTDEQISVGVVTVEDPDKFVSLEKEVFHFFHFLEFAVLAFAELQALGWSQAHTPSVAWWYSPLLTLPEICGSAGGMNCLLLNYLWPNLPPPQVNGLESNLPSMQAWHPAYKGVLHKRDKMGKSFTPDSDPTLSRERRRAMLDQVDVVLLIDRQRCKLEQSYNIHKIWTNYLDSFPGEAWHAAIRRQVESTTSAPVLHASATSTTTSSHPLLKVGYVDRQGSPRRLPDDVHVWLVAYLRRHPSVDFSHLHMQNYTASQQIALASELDMLVGVHGNGLSHLLWMKPESYVLEFFWEYSFQYDYASAAQLLNHTYRGLWNGHTLNATRIAQRDATLLPEYRIHPPQHMPSVAAWNTTSGQEAIRNFVDQAAANKLREEAQV